MKHLLLVFITVPTICLFAQILPEQYYEAIAQADSLVEHAHYESAARHYGSVFEQYSGNGTRFHKCMAGYFWSQSGNRDSAFYYLFNVADQGSYHLLKSILVSPTFKSLQNDPRWNDLQNRLYQNKRHWQQSVPTGYTLLKLSDFEVLVHEQARSMSTAATDSALIFLKDDLSKILSLPLKQSILDTLKSVRIFLDWDTGHATLQVHSSEDWLIQNGYQPEKIHQLEVSNLRQYLHLRLTNQPFVVMHEMAHTFHYKLSEKYKSKIRKNYLRAMNKGMYQKVGYRHIDGEIEDNVTSHAARDEFEYFAENTVAFLFGNNIHYPFSKADLRHYDKACYLTLRKIWKTKSKLN
jgi:hypothetical protein